MKEQTKAMDITEDEVLEMLATEVQKLAHPQPDDWHVLRVMSFYKIDNIEKARKVLRNVFDPLTEKGLYKRMKFANPNGGGWLVGYRKV